jgi:hypothetical protein
VEQSRTLRTLIVIAVTSPEYSALIEGKCNGPVSPVMSLLEPACMLWPSEKGSPVVPHRAAFKAI